MRRMGWLATASMIVAVLSVLGAQQAGAATRQPTILPTLGGGNAFVHAINDDGVIVGTSRLASGDWHAVRWQNGVVRDLGTLGGRNSTAWGIDDDGRIVGGSQGADGRSRAFVWERGRMRDLGVSGGMGSTAWAAGGGLIVGDYDTTGDLGGLQAFIWRAGQQIDIDAERGSTARAVNSRGQVAGTAGFRDFLDPETRFRRAFVWEDGAVHKLGTLGGTHSETYAMNEAGHVVGTSDTAAGELAAFFWDGAEMRRLSSPPDAFPTAHAINDADVVVGTFGAGAQTAVVWETPNAEPTVLPTPRGGSCPSAMDINNRGTIVGTACFNTSSGFFIRPVIWR